MVEIESCEKNRRDEADMTDREQRIRAIAHRLWEEEGRPPDQEKRHWDAAERMVDAEERSPSLAPGQQPTSVEMRPPAQAKPARKPGGTARSSTAPKKPRGRSGT